MVELLNGVLNIFVTKKKEYIFQKRFVSKKIEKRKFGTPNFMGSHRGLWACPQAPLPSTDSWLDSHTVTHVTPRTTPCKRPRYCLPWPVRGGSRPSALFGNAQASPILGNDHPSHPHGAGASVRCWRRTRVSRPRDVSTRGAEPCPKRLFALRTRQGHRCDVGDDHWRVCVASSC